ncbi:DEAD/DEAH box helicase [Pseudomonadota bacterium]
MFSHFPLHRLLLKTLKEEKFREPTPVQVEAIPLALEGYDLQVNSETGSGKTAAYLLPTLHHLLTTAKTDAGTRALVLVPTRELAKQIFTVCQTLIKHTQLDVALVCGGDNFENQVEALMAYPSIVIATTGRLMEHLQVGSPDFDDLDVLVLDEADRMLDMGFSEDVLAIAEACNPERQTLLFSATLDNKWLPGITKKLLREPEILTVSGGREAHANIHEQVILADDEVHKQRMVLWLLNNETYDKAIVFCNSREGAEKLAGILMPKRKRIGVLHGEVDKVKRARVMTLLREGKIDSIVATDVAARGLDIEGVDLVMNYDMPRRGDDYVHRIGRTGRAGKDGVALTFVKSTEWNLKASVERYLKRRFEPRTVPGFKAEYTGPKKLRASGKSIGKKKDKKKSTAKKGKQKKRDKSTTGKRNKPSSSGGHKN